MLHTKIGIENIIEYIKKTKISTRRWHLQVVKMEGKDRKEDLREAVLVAEIFSRHHPNHQQTAEQPQLWP